MKKCLLLIFLLCLGLTQVQAQRRTLTGLVKEKASGEPLPGVTVQERGTTNGTVTDSSGEFQLEVETGATLIFSFIGMEPVERRTGESNRIDVILETATEQVDEVVVTAMGIRKEKKALGYAVQDIGSEEIVRNKSANVVNALSGKIAGVSVTQSNGSAGSGAQIIVRGGTSLERDNQPLFVVDGVIYDNSTPIGGNSGFDGATRNSTTFGNRAMDINPEDIENMSILKGPAATALYGSRAAAGVILITTKKGQEGDVMVNVSSKFTASWVNRYPEQQDRYKRGFYNSAGVFSDFTTQSWGDPFGSGDVMYNNIEDFFQNGSTWDNSVNISGGNKNGTFFLSASRFDQEGIIPETGFEKSTFRFNGDQKFGMLTVGANVAYSVSGTDKTLTSSGLWGAGGNGAMTAVYGWARSENMKKYLNEDGTKYRMFEGRQPLADDVENPYWIINRNKLDDQTNRFTGSTFVNLDIADWFKISYRLGYDNYTKNDYTFIAPGGAVSETYQNGRLSESDVTYEYLSSNLMLTFNKKVADFDFNLLLGHSAEDTKTATQRRTGYNFITPGVYSFENIGNEDKFFQSVHSQKRLMGVFSEFRAAYKSIAYLTVTGRNDWTSTLPDNENSYFYPSVSGSFVFTELLPEQHAVSFGKLRASWAKVGKDTDPYVTTTSIWAPREFLGGIGVGNSWTRGNPYLKPEQTKSVELGLEMRFLGGRLGFDYTYYSNNSSDQIVTPRLSQTTGYILLSTNVGNVINKGMELSINATPVMTKNLTWDLNLNLSGNRGTVENLLTGQEVLYVTDVQVGNAKAASFNNGKFMGISGSQWSRDESGNLILDKNTGMPTSNNSTTNYLGNREPVFSGGLNNEFKWKNWSLSVLFDIRIGGDIFNGTDYLMTQAGMSKRSLDRESLTLAGVVAVGKDTDGNPVYEPASFTYQTGQSYDITTSSGAVQRRYGNDIIREYWSTYYPLETANFITKTNWLRLRSVSLSYNLPKDFFGARNVFKAMSVTVSGTNLWLLTNYKGMDPETSVAGSGVVGSGSSGIDYAGVPATAGVSLGVNMTF
ncbi:MAG: SusC/RagA family TonB-linked outer membrane protein [Prolixibacteraceae bacterium]